MTTPLRQLLAAPGFAAFLVGRIAILLASQIQTVAVGAQVYGLTHDPLDLGLIGLSQFLPFLLCVLPAGQMADRFDRKTIVAACMVLECACAIILWALTVHGLVSPWPMFAVMVPFGIARAVMAPAGQALLPNLVPKALFGRAVGVNSSIWQVATISGPAIGGMLYARLGPAWAYAITAGLGLSGVVATLLMRAPPQQKSAAAPTMQAVSEGLRFVWQRKPLLGAISLDLFAVLFGGAVALLPAYATDVLHVGAEGLGWLRAAPGIGATLLGFWLTARPIRRYAGPAMFGGVFVFGLATIVFGLSRSFTVSLIALAILGAADMVSVFVRHLLVQLETPDGMRGRVAAVNSMFIGASNELGEFESGLTAAWWGLIPAVVIGGVLTLAVVLACMGLFPMLRRMDRFPGAVHDET
jgi:MFS family permease